MKTGIRKVLDNLPRLQAGVDRLSTLEVLAGVPRDKTQRNEEPMITNAAIAFIQDQGSPAQNIPARPFMRPGISNAKEAIATSFKRAAKRAVDGQTNASVEEDLHRAGLKAQNSIRAAINEGIPPPLSIATLKARARRGRKGAKKALEAINAGGPANIADAKPLVDSGQLRNSITYVVRKK